MYILSLYTLYLKVLNGCFELFMHGKRLFPMTIRDVQPVWWNRKELHGWENDGIGGKASRKVEIEASI